MYKLFIETIASSGSGISVHSFIESFDSKLDADFAFSQINEKWYKGNKKFELSNSVAVKLYPAE